MPAQLPSVPSKSALIDDTEPRYRSGAAARMARMPVATLRTWERRFQVGAPNAASGGHRLYSAADVHRLTLLKQLSGMGHSIGQIARLPIDQLRDVATTHATIQARTLIHPGAGAEVSAAPWRVAVVGLPLAARLRRSPLLQRLGRALDGVGPFASLADALAAAPAEVPGEEAAIPSSARAPVLRAGCELLLVEWPSLQHDDVRTLSHLASAWRAEQSAVLCAYGTASACEAARSAGFAVLRGSLGDEALADWLRWLSDQGAASADPQAQAHPSQAPAPWAVPGAPPPRRFDDKTLADIAALSSSVACECPRHVSELLIMLSAFEAYSADCASQSVVDADLHRYLQRAAAASRANLELALERIALHEGLVLRN